jgi:hypothetical protein
VLAVFTILVFPALSLAQTSTAAPTPHLDLHPAPHLSLHAAEVGDQGELATTNVKLDLTIADTYTGEPSQKTVSMLLLNRESGLIRTSNRLPSGAGVNLNVDARVEILDADLVKVMVTFEYTPAQEPHPAATQPGRPAELHESLTVVLKNGESLIVSRSADPASDRTVTVELTATVLR